MHPAIKYDLIKKFNRLNIIQISELTKYMHLAKVLLNKKYSHLNTI